jgi:hypothetical protein
VFLIISMASHCVFPAFSMISYLNMVYPF